MPAQSNADNAAYRDLRERALHLRRSGHLPGVLSAVLMDWTSDIGAATVLATADGTASIYLSDGSSLTGGSLADPALRKTALRAMQLAQLAHHRASPVSGTPIPPEGEISFYLITAEGPLRLEVSERSLRSASHPLRPLAAAMQQVVTLYRSVDRQQQQAHNPPPRPSSLPSKSAGPEPSHQTIPQELLWGQQDRFGRGVQAICGAVMLLAAIALFAVSATQSSYSRGGAGATGIGCLYLSVRCFWYAATGRDNINRDDF